MLWVDCVSADFTCPPPSPPSPPLHPPTLQELSDLISFLTPLSWSVKMNYSVAVIPEEALTWPHASSESERMIG